VVDAAGAIYVIGGAGDVRRIYTTFNDVWVSTDKGADRTRACSTKYSRVFKRSTRGYCRGTAGVLQGYSMGT
jgi:hypothetical protein